MGRSAWLLLLLLACCGVKGQAAALSVESRVVKAERFSGADLGTKLAAADRELGAARGLIEVESAGEIQTGFTLHAGHGLMFHAPVVWRATVTLMGGNEVSCGSGIEIKAVMDAYVPPSATNMLMLTKGGSGIRVHGCRFSAVAPSVVLVGYPMSDIAMDGNTLQGLTLAATDGGTSTDLSFNGNVITMPRQGSRNAAVLLFFAKRVKGTGNRFTRTAHGVQWWGGDSGAPSSTIEQVRASGEMVFVGNVCNDVAGACLWGSMGYQIQMRGNTAVGCGDVCFDTEGGVDTTIAGNVAKGCGNGCAAMFFFGKNVAITGNTFTGMSPGGGLILLKNVSRNPSRYSGIDIADNVLRCEPGPCHAAYTEAAAGVRFEGNEVSNGTYRAVGYGQAVSIVNNHFLFMKPLAVGAEAIGAPAMTGGTTLEITGNTIESNVAQGADSICIGASWSDFNASDKHMIVGNRCDGSNPFPIDVSTTTNGANSWHAGDLDREQQPSWIQSCDSWEGSGK
jgi:hypothetical protein